MTVGQDDYFVRYVESFTNPTASPITVEVSLDSHYAFLRSSCGPLGCEEAVEARQPRRAGGRSAKAGRG